MYICAANCVCVLFACCRVYHLRWIPYYIYFSIKKEIRRAITKARRRPIRHELHDAKDKNKDDANEAMCLFRNSVTGIINDGRESSSSNYMTMMNEDRN